MDSYHRNMTNTLHLDTYIEDHFCIRLKWLAFQDKSVEFPDTTSPNSCVMMLDLQWRNIRAQHPIDRKRNDDLCHDHQMYPITEVKHLHYQPLPMIAPIPVKKKHIILIFTWTRKVKRTISTSFLFITYIFVYSILVDGPNCWHMRTQQLW